MKKSYEDIHGKKYNRWLILFVVVLIAFAGTIMQTSLSTALLRLRPRIICWSMGLLCHYLRYF